MNKTPFPIKAYARFKPLTTKESDICINSLIKHTNTQILIDNKKEQTYSFTQVFNPKTTQPIIFDTILSTMIKDCLNGYNSSLITYGGSESGKSFSLMGPAYALYDNESEYHGIIPRFIKFIYDDSKMISLANAANVHIGVNFECIEVDSEKVIDLLKGVNVFPKKTPYTKVELTNYSNAKNTLLQGFKNRNVANKDATLIYSFTIDSVLTSKLTDKISSHQSRIMFVDLANSNSKSVGVLNNILNMLIKKYKYIDFSSNKLTSILQPCLCGDFKTSFFFTLSQSVINISDTLSVLDFNQKITSLTNDVSQHENLKDALQLMVKENSKISETLKKSLEESGKESGNIFKTMTYTQKSRNFQENENRNEDTPFIKNLKLLLNDEAIKSFLDKKEKFDQEVNDFYKKYKDDDIIGNKEDKSKMYYSKRLLEEVKGIKKIREIENSLIDLIKQIDFTKINKFINELSNENLKEIILNYLSKENKFSLYKSKEEELNNKINEKSLENFVLKNYINKLKESQNNEKTKIFKLNEELISKLSDSIFANYEVEDKSKLSLSYFDEIVSSFIDFKEKSICLEKQLQANEIIILDKNEEISKLKSNLELESSKLQIANEKIKSMEESIIIYNKSILAFKAQVDKINKEVNFEDIYIQINNINSKVEALFKQYENDLNGISNFMNKTSKKIFDLPILKSGANAKMSFIDLKNKEKELNNKNTIIEDLQKHNNLLKNEIIKLKTEITRLKKENEETKKENAKFEKEKKEFEQKLKEAETINSKIIKEKNEEIHHIQTELFETNKIKQEIEKKIIEEEEKTQKLNLQLEEALVQKLKIQTEKENLNSSLKESNMKLTKAQEEINSLIVEKKQEIEKMSTAIEKLNEEKENIIKLKEEGEKRHIEISNALRETQKQIEKSKEESEFKLKSELNKLSMEKLNLEKKTVEYEKREKNLNSQVETLEYQRGELNKEKSNLEKEKYQKIQENMQLSDKVKEILDQLSKLQIEKNEIDQNLISTKEKLNQTEKELRDIIKQKEDQIQSVNNKLSELERQKEELLLKKKQIEDSCQSLTQKINELLEQVKQLENEKSLIDKTKGEEIDDISKRIASMNKLIESLQKELETNEELRKNLEKNKEQYEKDNEALLIEKKSLEEHLTQMKEQMIKQEQQFKNEITNYQISSKNLNSTIEKLKIEKEKITKEKKQIQVQATELGKKVVTLNKEKEKVESEKKYLNTTVSSLLEELDTYKSSDFQSMKIQNQKFQQKFKSIFGKNLDMEAFLSNESNNVSIKWDQTTLSKLTQKILQLREEKKTLSNDLLLLQSDMNRTLSGSLAESQFTLLMKIKEENRKLRKEIANIKKRYSKLEQEIKLAYFNSLNPDDIANDEILQNNYYDIIAKIIDSESNPSTDDNTVIWKGTLEDKGSTPNLKKKKINSVVFSDKSNNVSSAKSLNTNEENNKKDKINAKTSLKKTKSTNISSNSKKISSMKK